jgi:hypothetical protein
MKACSKTKIPASADAGRSNKEETNLSNIRSLNRTYGTDGNYKRFGFLNLRISIILLIIVIGGGVGTGLTRRSSGKPQAEFVDAGGSIRMDGLVRGQARNIPEGYALWIVQQPFWGDFFCKQAVVKPDGSFSCSMGFGTDQHKDRTFRVYAMLLRRGETIPEMTPQSGLPKHNQVIAETQFTRL